MSRVNGTSRWLRVPLLAARRPPGKHEPEICPVCGERFRPWAGSRLPCHARCLFTEEGRAEILSLWHDNTRLGGIAEIAQHMGTTTSVVRSVLVDEGIRVGRA